MGGESNKQTEKSNPAPINVENTENAGAGENAGVIGIASAIDILENAIKKSDNTDGNAETVETGDTSTGSSDEVAQLRKTVDELTKQMGRMVSIMGARINPTAGNAPDPTTVDESATMMGSNVIQQEDAPSLKDITVELH